MFSRNSPTHVPLTRGRGSRSTLVVRCANAAPAPVSSCACTQVSTMSFLRRAVLSRSFLPVRGKFSKRQDIIGNTTPKRMNRRYYKGKGANKGGFVTNKGVFVRDASRTMTIIPPDMTDCKLGPYVEHGTPRVGEAEVTPATST